MTIEAGLAGAFRTVQSSAVRDVYGNGFVVLPSLALRVRGGLAVGLAYELGYDRSGTIGLYKEPTRLTVRGWEVFLRWDVTSRRVAPYLKAGLGGFRYEQEIESAVPLSDRAQGRKTAPLIGAGARVRLSDRLAGRLEILYIPLKVKPFDVDVDLGGWRVGLGLDFAVLR